MRCLALKAKSPEIALTMSWQSSNTPRTAMLKMFASCSEYICAAWKALMRPYGESMKTCTFFLPRSAYSAEDPVSPEVADHVEPPAVLLQRVLEEVAEELQRDVLEGGRGPVGEAEGIEALLD